MLRTATVETIVLLGKVDQARELQWIKTPGERLGGSGEAMGYAVCYLDEQGYEQTASGEDLLQIAEELFVQGYEGPTLRVRDEAGWTKGWVGVRGGSPFWRCG